MSKKKKPLRLTVKNLIRSKIDRKILEVGPFSMDIEVLGVDEDDLKAGLAAQKVVFDYQSRYKKEFEALQKKLKSLQAEEQIGKNPKAYDEAKSLVKKMSDELEQDVDEIRVDIREAVKKVTKKKTRTIGRTSFREMRLARGAFSGDVGDAKFVTSPSPRSRSMPLAARWKSYSKTKGRTLTIC